MHLSKERKISPHSRKYANASLPRLTDCYQRLEFLGDAVIDYVVTRYLYEGPYKFNPGQLTDLRSSLVNNTFFASLVVKNKLHKFLRHLNPGLFSAIGRFVASQEQDNSCQEEEDTADSWKQELINLNTPQKEPDDPDFARKALEVCGGCTWDVTTRITCNSHVCDGHMIIAV